MLRFLGLVESCTAGGRVAGAMIAFRTLLGENPAAPGQAYLANMAPRLIELRRMFAFGNHAHAEP